MANLGIPVPPGFTITTEVCIEYYNHHQQYLDGVKEQVAKQLNKLEKEIGFSLENGTHSLLLSVRSGARISMPGIMDTLLKGLAEETDGRFTYNCYKHFINIFELSGTLEYFIRKSDPEMSCTSWVVGATSKRGGAIYKEQYIKSGIKAIWQGSEDNEVYNTPSQIRLFHVMGKGVKQ